MKAYRQLTAASRKRVTRRILNRLRYLRCWHQDALMVASIEAEEGNAALVAVWEAEADRLAAEYAELERSIA